MASFTEISSQRICSSRATPSRLLTLVWLEKFDLGHLSQTMLAHAGTEHRRFFLEALTITVQSTSLLLVPLWRSSISCGPYSQAIMKQTRSTRRVQSWVAQHKPSGPKATSSLLKSALHSLNSCQPRSVS